jgi:5-methylthioadenosine/S-adenosylhomocysteine deaminase
LRALQSEDISVIREVHYHQYDTYFFFDDPAQGRLRYREDEFLDRQDQVANVRARLTLTGPSREGAFGSVLLFRSRFFAPATHSPRFYREYFKPAREREIEKDRRRWLVAYRGVQFYVHLDRLLNPAREGSFVEVKSRTWSRRDAEDKAAVIAPLLERLGARPDDAIEADYVELQGDPR